MPPAIPPTTKPPQHQISSKPKGASNPIGSSAGSSTRKPSTPASFNGYDKDHTKLLVEYIFQLTPEEQRRVSASMGRTRASADVSSSGVSAAVGGSAQRAPK